MTLMTQTLETIMRLRLPIGFRRCLAAFLAYITLMSAVGAGGEPSNGVGQPGCNAGPVNPAKPSSEECHDRILPVRCTTEEIEVLKVSNDELPGRRAGPLVHWRPGASASERSKGPFGCRDYRWLDRWLSIATFCTGYEKS